MKVTRIIHPIGQGAFYTEKLSNGSDEINVVYDCGGFNRDQTKMKEYLKSYLGRLDPKSRKKEIEAVFISHFHDDHINGLQYLLENSRVKYLFLPQLKDDIILEAYMYNYCQTGPDNQVNRFLLDLYNGESFYRRDSDDDFSTRIIQVEEANDDNEQNDNDVVHDQWNFDGFNDIDQSDNDLSIESWNLKDGNKKLWLYKKNIIPLGTVLHCGKWLYIPFHSKVAADKRKKLRESLEMVFGEKIKVENLPNLFNDLDVKTCKKIYNRIFDNQHNSYSMTLFSGIMNLDAIKKYASLLQLNTDCDKCLHPEYFNQRWNPNFLYTGDFEPKNNIDDLTRFFHSVWQKIASIQVPHHGSKDNFAKALYEYPIRGIVSVGNDNPYHHPNIDTLIKIQEQDCRPVIVTEDKSSMKIYLYKCC